MFKWIMKILGVSPFAWYVEGWESEHEIDYGDSELTGPFKTEQKAMDYAKKHYGESLWCVEMMEKP